MQSGYRLAIAIAVVAALFLGTTLALLLSDNDSVTPVLAQENGVDRGISVQGEGQVSVVPDTAYVVLGVQLEGEEIEDIRDDANSRMDDVINGLQDDGVDEGDIRTVTYDISVTRDWERQNAPIIGYTLTHLVEVKVSDLDRTGEIIDNAVDNGANNVGNIRFEVEDRDTVIRQAREQAMENARDKASHLAELGDVNLGAPIRITESSPSLPPIPFDEPAMERDAVDEGIATARIEPGESIVTVRVNVTYAIE